MIIPEKTIKNLEIALKVRRKEHHLTQESLSDMTGISKRHITKIENDGEIHSEYETRILKDIKNTLKEEGGDGHTYSPEQQKLMVWYTYFFLNRGKPSTHIAALSQLSDEELKENVPPVLQRLIETADHILKGDKNENCAS